MWLYVFGSAARGEVDENSDLDILAVLEDKSAQTRLPKNFLIYSKSELSSCFERGDLFAHHLAWESRLIYTHDSTNIIHDLGRPAPYQSGEIDFDCFYQIGIEAISKIMSKNCSLVFELGILYMAIRDAAMINSYHENERPSFSKYAPYSITPRLTLDREKYEHMKNSRAASTRGSTKNTNNHAPSDVDLTVIRQWLDSARRSLHEGIQKKNRMAAKGTGIC